MDVFRFGNKEFDCINVELNQEQGFNFPFRILVPNNLKQSPELVYAWTLPLGGPHGAELFEEHTSFERLQEEANNEISSIDPIMLHLLEEGNLMIIPAIPRFSGFRPSFLGSDVYNNDFSKYEGSWYKDYLEKYRNLPDQIKNMISYSISLLREKSINVPDKVIMTGYSEGSKGVSHFALLHPEIIKAIVVGGTSGLMPVPLKELEGYTLKYPIGINDISNFDYDSYKSIKFFYYTGENDLSDPGLPNFKEYHYINEKGEDCILKDECGNLTPHLDENGNAEFLLDENGNYTAKFRLFTNEEVNILNKIYGTKVIDRFKKQERVISELGLDVECHIYPGNHRTVFENIKQITSDIDSFLGFDKKQLK